MITDTMQQPDYKQIYMDILHKKFIEKKEELEILLEKERFSAIEIIEINTKIFGKTSETNNGRHRSYSKSAIFKILDYQKEHQLNNSQLANHFKLSRNTIAKWKKLFF
ncbi:helix-turn-helix domain-containing protein [Chryseobacterium sp. NRRL B-14798]|uniref:helix-turn-helix domain-containing protein n=1 Tax=Chryseobacterium sp. NRRL B-14798 TaxID=3162880 RepID=UPI003D1F7593